MLYHVKDDQFLTVSIEREAYAPENHEILRRIIVAFGSKWHTLLTGPRMSIMLFVMSRTFILGKSASQISASDFIKGCTDVYPTEGMRVARSCIQNNIRSLIQDNLLDVWSTASKAGAEKEARIFAINCKVFLANMDFSNPKLGITLPSAEGTPALRRGHPLIHKYVVPTVLYRLDKSNQVSTTSRRAITEDTNVLPIPKRPRPATERIESTREAATKLMSGFSAARAHRTATAVNKPAHAMNKLELQALLDSTTTKMSQERMIVTDKHWSVLKKRVKENAPDDFAEFLSYTVANWHSVAAGQRAAAKRRVSEGEKYSAPIPMAPSFQTLAYRYPYFLAVYRNKQAEKAYDGKDERDVKIDRLSRALVAAKQDASSVRSQLLKRTRPTTSVPHVLQEALDEVSLASTTDLPTWEEATANSKNRR